MGYLAKLNEKIMILYRMLGKIYPKLSISLLSLILAYLILYSFYESTLINVHMIIYAIFAFYYIILSLSIYNETRRVYRESFIYSILAIGLTYNLFLIGLFYLLKMVSLHIISIIILILSILPILGYLSLNFFRIKITIDYRQITFRPTFISFQPAILLLALILVCILEILGYHELIIHFPLLLASALIIRLLEFRSKKEDVSVFGSKVYDVFKYIIEHKKGPLIVLVESRSKKNISYESISDLLKKYINLGNKGIVEFVFSDSIKATSINGNNHGKILPPVIIRYEEQYIYENVFRRLTSVIDKIKNDLSNDNNGLVFILRTSILEQLPGPFPLKYLWFRTLVDLLDEKDTLILINDTPGKSSLGPIEYFISFVIHID